jgi:hypothetical protein
VLEKVSIFSDTPYVDLQFSTWTMSKNESHKVEVENNLARSAMM